MKPILINGRLPKVQDIRQDREPETDPEQMGRGFFVAKLDPNWKYSDTPSGPDVSLKQALLGLLKQAGTKPVERPETPLEGKVKPDTEQRGT